MTGKYSCYGPAHSCRHLANIKSCPGILSHHPHSPGRPGQAPAAARQRQGRPQTPRNWTQQKPIYNCAAKEAISVLALPARLSKNSSPWIIPTATQQGSYEYLQTPRKTLTLSLHKWDLQTFKLEKKDKDTWRNNMKTPKSIFKKSSPKWEGKWRHALGLSWNSLESHSNRLFIY